jgi:hypothetical protein
VWQSCLANAREFVLRPAVFDPNFTWVSAILLNPSLKSRVVCVEQAVDRINYKEVEVLEELRSEWR